MPRLMSVTLTKEAVVGRRKTETRRAGWLHARPGEVLDLCEKVMGRRKGDPLIRLARVRITSVTREPLNRITDAAVDREGFTSLDLGPWMLDAASPGALARAFVRFYGEHMGALPEDEVTVITWEYLPTPAEWTQRA